MSAQEPLVRNISDTALLAAVYRARETERPDAVFRDPFRRSLGPGPRRGHVNRPSVSGAEERRAAVL